MSLVIHFSATLSEDWKCGTCGSPVLEHAPLHLCKIIAHYSKTFHLLHTTSVNSTLPTTQSYQKPFRDCILDIKDNSAYIYKM